MDRTMARGILYTVTLLGTFGLTVLISRFLIPYLKSKKMGQKILEIGPRWHKNKEGTPTMGGLAFIVAALAVLVITVPLSLHFGTLSEVGGLLLALGYALLNGVIGVIDDSAKFKKGKNQGLTPFQKYFLQLFAACIFLFAGVYTGIIAGKPTDSLYIPFIGNVFILQYTAVRILYYVFCLILLTGMVNAVNLTDGIDGLAATITLVVSLAFSACTALTVFKVNGLPGAEAAQLLSAATAGGCAGFLVYNFHPAKVFMGDTGSLFLGGMVVSLAFLMKNPLIIVFFGLVYILETLSVILQVGYFKLTHGKRLFKMSPIHHHFEKCGWSEIKIVSAFSAATAVFSLLGLVDYII